jgi:hypothetical protein
VVGGINQPDEPFRAVQDPSLEQSQPSGDPTPQLGYPPSAPPVYPQPGDGYRSFDPAHRSSPPPRYPGYPADPHDHYPMGRPSGTNRKAIAALVTSLVGLLFCGLPSIVGMVLGIVALGETKRTGQKGRGLALAAAIIGGVVIVVVVGGVILFVVKLSGECGLVNHHTGCY